jgi:hypothetical protein
MSRRGSQAARAAQMTGAGWQKQRRAELALADIGPAVAGITVELGRMAEALPVLGDALRWFTVRASR